MSKLGQRLIAAAREGRAIVRGEADPATYRVYVPSEVDVRRIRRQLGLSQDEFAARFGLSAATVREWEQDRRKPEGAARVLLTVIEKEPEAVTRALVGDARGESLVVAAKVRRTTVKSTGRPRPSRGTAQKPTKRA
jgi:putative transcriptional regulator